MSTLQKLTYRFTLNAFKNGIQRILQGWVTGEHLSRSMEISLLSGNDPYELPLSGVTASMYVTSPSGVLSINACTVDADNNKIVYDILDSDISEAGLVNMQLKIFDSQKILISPSFQLEVWESTISDSQAILSPPYTALTAALAQAEAYAEKAIVQAYIDEDYTFVIEFADGTEYTSSALKDCYEDCEAEALKAEGYAVGKQNGVDVTSGSPYYQNNAKYYSGQANGYKNMAENAKEYAYEYANDALGYKNDASGYADAAGDYADDAHDEYLASKSYAVGGTGTRAGEDTDNAKYYKEVCETIVGGGYAAKDVTYVNTVSELSAENVQDAVDEVKDITDSKAEMSGISAVKTISTLVNDTGAQIDEGTIFYVGNQLCRAITNIAANASLTLNTNYAYCTVADRVETLSAKMLKTSTTLSYDMSGNETATFTVSASSSFLIFISGRSANAGSIFTSFTTVSNATYLTDIFKGSDITASASGNQITIQNGGQYTCHVQFIGFNGTNTNNNTTVVKNS